MQHIVSISVPMEDILKITAKRMLRKTMVLTATVVYRHVFTHNSCGYISSIRLIADCEQLTTEEQLFSHNLSLTQQQWGFT